MSEPLRKAGDSMDAPPDLRLLSIDVRWNAGGQTAFSDRMGVAALPLVRGRLRSRDHVVFQNQPMTPDASIRLTPTPGLMQVDLTAVPDEVEQISVVAYVQPRPNAPRRTIDQLDGLSMSLADGLTGRTVARSVSLASSMGSVTAATLLDLFRDNTSWKFVVQTRGYESGLEGAAAQGGLTL